MIASTNMLGDERRVRSSIMARAVKVIWRYDLAWSWLISGGILFRPRRCSKLVNPDCDAACNGLCVLRNRSCQRRQRLAEPYCVVSACKGDAALLTLGNSWLKIDLKERPFVACTRDYNVVSRAFLSVLSVTSNACCRPSYFGGEMGHTPGHVDPDET